MLGGGIMSALHMFAGRMSKVCREGRIPREAVEPTNAAASLALGLAAIR